MGTNYYHKTDICPTCGRFEQKHIGKSSAGWTFSFQGDATIRSFTDWKHRFRTHPLGLIFDEYGNSINYDEFCEMVEAKKTENRNHAQQYPEHSWLDSEGNSFTGREFC